MDMSLYINNTLLPYPSDFTRVFKPNDQTNQDLSGDINTRFLNNQRSWKLVWSNLKKADYQIIQNLYLQQYAAAAFPVMQFDAYSLYVPVKLEMSDHDIKYNGEIIGNLTLILKEKYPIS